MRRQPRTHLPDTRPSLSRRCRRRRRAGRHRSAERCSCRAGDGLMKIFLWHVHGSWTTAFVQGPHEYLIPVLPDRGPDGRGRAQTWDWPSSVREVTPEEAARADVDVIIMQRPVELEGLAEHWLGGCPPGRRPPRALPPQNAPP